MDDGMIQLLVEEASPEEVRCRVVVGGRISDHKGISLPHVPLPVSCLTDKDREDLRFGLEHAVDFVAVSFVRSAADVGELRDFLRELGADVPIVAKLERHEGILNLPDILPSVEAVMVARGDLGVDVPLEDVPHLQKEIVRQAREAGVPVIVATQMLETMVTHLRPTRAEVSDVSTAIFDGADAIMLSAETATGRYPAEAVEVMARIAERAERAVLVDETRRRRPERVGVGFSEAISTAASAAGHALGARAIVAFTESGASARLISQARPDVPIIALTPFVEFRRRLALLFVVSSLLNPKGQRTGDRSEEVEEMLLGRRRVGRVIVVLRAAAEGEARRRMWSSTPRTKARRACERGRATRSRRRGGPVNVVVRAAAAGEASL